MIEIRDGRPEDAALIAEAIMEAVGEEIVEGMAGERSREDVKGVFTRLALREDSQYSWRNTRVAFDEGGRRAGVCISYDGALLRPLRRSFFEEANKTFGWGLTPEQVEALPGETNGEEYYLDTLMTLPEYRRKGVATTLIEDASRKARRAGKPLGLLVDDANPRARRLYESLGFREVARRPFAGVDMANMRLG